ncbi:MAG TPA: hypothetical protein VNZ26_05510 [Vicinamibacterales bacterium]|nr:hypothetical protein [Vicinamibacterales bacterium]
MVYTAIGDYDSHGGEKVVWESELVNVPVDAYVAFDGPVVVTIDTTCRELLSTRW